MKKIISIAAIAFAFASVLSCQKENIEPVVPEIKQEMSSKTFFATIEDSDTRTTFSGTQSIWEEGDLVAVFPGSTTPHKYMVAEGEGGTGTARLVETEYDKCPDWWTGSSQYYVYNVLDTTPISANVAFYPYYYGNYDKVYQNSNGERFFLPSNTCTEIETGVFQLSTKFSDDPETDKLPMVAVSDGTDDMNLNFKNLAGMLKVSFSVVGEGAVVLAGVYVEGNNGEILAGPATVTAYRGGDPVVEMDPSGDTRLMVFADYETCEPVTLNTGDTWDMYIPVPPTTFSKGIKMTYVTMSGNCEKTISREFTVARSHIVPLGNIELHPDPTVLYYKTTDGNPVEPTRILGKDKDGNALTYTNTYGYSALFDDNVGSITFSGLVDSLDFSFSNIETLTRFYGASMKVSIVDATCMFMGCSNLDDVDFMGFDFSAVKSMQAMFALCGNLRRVWGIEDADVSKVQNMMNMFCDCTSLENIDLSGWNAPELRDMSAMFSGCSNLGYVEGLNKIGASKLQTIEAMFYKCSSLGYLDLSGMDTPMLENMSWAFGYCYALEELDLTSLNTQNVTTMRLMLYNDFNLTSIKGLETLNTSSVTSMDAMFSGCNALQNINLSKFDTSNVEDFGYMFSACLNLKSLDLSSFNTGKAQSMLGMFDRCQSITRLDLSSFNTSNVTDMSSMFYQCESLSSLDVSSFNTENVTDMQFMFAWLWALPSIDVSNFDTSNVTSMYAMFNNCNGFTHLDLSGFNTSKVTDFSYMFEDSANLQSVDISGFDTSAAQTVESMFATCPKLNSIKVGAKTNMCTFDNTMFSNVAAGGTLHYPAGSDYSFWLSSAYGCLGSYGWNGVEYGGAPYSPAEGGNEGIGYENWD